MKSTPFGDGWEEVGCVLCQQPTENRPVWPDHQRGHVVACRRCGLVFRNPRRPQAELARHFAEEWTEARPAFFLEAYRLPNLRRVLAWILARFPGPGRILDIGASYGALLSLFPPGWDLFGLEPSHTACEAARERLPGAVIVRGTLETADLPALSFDVITMVDTIYYLPHPLRDLARLRSLLRPGGFALIEAQNFANRGRVYRWLSHPFDHTWMYFYSPETLEKMLHKAGLAVTDRLDLPGHRLGSPNRSARTVARLESWLAAALRGASGSRLDLAPHFVLAARPF